MHEPEPAQNQFPRPSLLHEIQLKENAKIIAWGLYNMEYIHRKEIILIIGQRNKPKISHFKETK